MAEARDVVAAVEKSGVVMGVNAQYPAAIGPWIELYRKAFGKEPYLRDGFFVMDTKGEPRSPHGAAEVWVDLAPHPIALLDKLAPGGIDWSTLEHEDGPMEVDVKFKWINPEWTINAHIECRRTPGGPVRRLLGDQDMIAEYDGVNVEGEFKARLRYQDQEWVGKDFMQFSVERFLEAVRTGDRTRLIVDPQAALRQMEALVGVWDRCWGSGRSRT
jgi:predicted dehydrogenase